MEQRFPDRGHSDRAAIADLADELLRFDHKTIGDLEGALDESQEAFEKYEEKNPPFGEEGRRFLDVGVVRVSLFQVNPRCSMPLLTKSRSTADDRDREGRGP